MGKAVFGFFVWIFLLILEGGGCVNVHFENKDGGFFLKQSPRQHYVPSSSPGDEGGSSGQGSLLSVDRFTVFQSSQPISVRATYGPFSTKQTVPARYVVPDPIPLNTTGTSIDLQELATHHLDMSAHIVRNEIPRDSPVLRVLFHTGTDSSGRRHIMLTRHHQVCIVLHATLGNYPTLTAACSPDGEDGVCLAQITIPSTWWPPLPSPDKDGRIGKIMKTPPKLVQVAYSVQEPRPDESTCQPQMQLQPSTLLGVVPLVPAKAAYKELQLVEALRILVPHPPLFPLSRMHIPVFLERGKSKSITAVIIRGRVKSGVRLLGATATDPSTWNITVETNPRHTGATVTAMRREPLEPPSDGTTSPSASSQGEVFELFTWLVEITEDAAEPYEDARIVWSARYEPHQEEPAAGSGNAEPHRIGGTKSTTRLDIQKDDIQAVVPISKNWEVLNTAVLTGRQVSQAMKVFIVSQAGKAADVTFQASCHSEDDSVLKVSSSCSSVYVDGSEARGSMNGSVLVKYGTYTGLARFTVWMPEFPLDLQVPDTRLSQLKSWKVPDYQPSSVKARRKKRSYGSSFRTTPDDMGNVVERPNCRLRYQQSTVDVYAHFMASDRDSGRTTYLINRRTWLRVTDLVLPLLRISDPRIASLHGRVLQGRSVGRTEVQVLSPITGRVIGAKEVRVGNDKVALTRLSVQVVSGLQLNISPDGAIENGYVAETSVTRKLTAQYQEGLLDIELEFNDGNKTPLRDVADSDYHLVVESLDPEVVAFAPMVASHHPRVIAVGEGNGDLLQVTLLLPEECRSAVRSKSKAGPLATAAASVVVDFSSSDLPHRPDILLNDGGSFGGPKSRDFPDLQDITKGNTKGDDPKVQARQYQGTKGSNRHQSSMLMTPLEISMYVLLAGFCFAIVVFVVSCVVYASRFNPSEVGIDGLRAAPVSTTTIGFGGGNHRNSRETTTNVHDWVWLGRATLEPTSNRNSTATNNNTSEMRITTNPLNQNYCDPDDCVTTSFSNPTHIELPSRPIDSRIIDSSTYCKSKAGGRTIAASVEPNGMVNDDSLEEVISDDVEIWNKPTPPPPLPPHGIPIKTLPEAPCDEEYRPPVPPHRNIMTSITIQSNSVDPAQRKHHHHHHHRNSKHQPKQTELSIARDDDDILEAAQLDSKCNLFEFDDEPVQSEKVAPNNPITTEGVVMRQKHTSSNNSGDEMMQFVQYPKSPNNGNNRNSAEVKRATIVGNPMFSSSENQTEETNADLGGLGGLQLDMDYEQIMHYFDNLKESNA